MKKNLRKNLNVTIVLLLGFVILFFDYNLFIKLKELHQQIEKKSEILKKYRNTFKKLPEIEKQFKNLHKEHEISLKFIFNDPNESLAYASFSEFLAKLAINLRIKHINMTPKKSENIGDFVEIKLNVNIISEDLKKILRFIEEIEYNKNKIMRISYVMIKREMHLKNNVYRLKLIVGALWKKGIE